MVRTLSHSQARAFYDRFGAKQDLQGWYEDAAVDDLVAHLSLGDARHVAEFGCGTGRLAARLLASQLPPWARYTAADQSATMVGLARDRTRGDSTRCQVTQGDGTPRWPVDDGAADRLLSTYVTDLLSDEDITALLTDAWRALAPGGLLGLVSLTRGEGVLSRVVTGLWETAHRLNPVWVGGCRPLALRGYLPDRWTVTHHRVLTVLGLGSEVLVARKVDAGSAAA
ncbi:MAG: class I SAM-dependent methyltransferase [Deltaproteobacteria bacterium]|nr:class I SAM-dependent methyltransferase [Deltaproteobacteria bacterium]